MVRRQASTPGLQASSDPQRSADQGPLRGTSDPVEELVAATYADVWRLCSALVDADRADDLAQETFLRATTALHRFRGRASKRTWIFAIARHVCMDELRGRHRRRRRDERLAAAPGGTHDADLSGEIAIGELLQQLDPDRRAAFVLTQMFRLPYQEAATVCGCPTGTIRSRVARARDDLIRLMDGDWGDWRTGHTTRHDNRRVHGPGGNV
jgi:RNA polymerase sigma-70 factor, ECF subfamily